MKIEVIVTGQDKLYNALKNFNTKFMKRLQEEMKMLGAKIEGQAKINTTPNVNTGRLRSSITHRVKQKKDEVQVEVGSNVKYASYLEYGTKPHFPPVYSLSKWVERKIRPKKSDVMRITYLIAKKIAMSGTKAYPYLRPAIRSAYDNIDSILKKSLEIVLTEKQ